jgi:hypothetical protein
VAVVERSGVPEKAAALPLAEEALPDADVQEARTPARGDAVVAVAVAAALQVSRRAVAAAPGAEVAAVRR